MSERERERWGREKFLWQDQLMMNLNVKIYDCGGGGGECKKKKENLKFIPIGTVVSVVVVVVVVFHHLFFGPHFFCSSLKCVVMASSHLTCICVSVCVWWTKWKKEIDHFFSLVSVCVYMYITHIFIWNLIKKNFFFVFFFFPLFWLCPHFGFSFIFNKRQQRTIIIIIISAEIRFKWNRQITKIKMVCFLLTALSIHTHAKQDDQYRLFVFYMM